LTQSLPRPLFRRATQRDLPAVVALLAADDIGATRECIDRTAAKEYERAFARMHQQDSNWLFVGELEHTIIACAQLTVIHGLSRRGATRGQIEGLRVADSMRSRGVGQAFMEFLIQEAAAAGCFIVQLTSDARRKRALAFYESLGFTPSHVGFKRDIAQRS
jgi:GNAT superfamily N-acetyltransferase